MEDERDGAAAQILQVMAELHVLTKLPRTGWIMAGVGDPESVSDHCFEAAILAVLVASKSESDVDIGKVVRMLIFHELSECRLTDLPRRSGPYVREMKHTAEEEIAKDVVGTVAPEILDLVAEFHERQTPEAKMAEAAEELQIIFAALMYAKEGNGDMSEYPNDVSKYDSYGNGVAADVASVIGDRLNEYLSGKSYWSVGYDRPIQ